MPFELKGKYYTQDEVPTAGLSPFKQCGLWIHARKQLYIILKTLGAHERADADYME